MLPQPRRTYPDYGSSPGQLPGPDIDLAELASRTGSVSSYRRTGRVIYYDDMHYQSFIPEDGITTFQLFTEKHYSRDASLLITPAAGVIATYNYKYLPVVTGHKVGLEATLCAVDNAGVNYYGVGIGLDIRKGSDAWYGIARIEYQSKKVQVMTGTSGPDDTFTDIDGISFISWPWAYNWLNLKMVLDLDLNTYQDIYVNEREYLGVNIPMINSIAAGQSTGLMLVVYDKLQLQKRGAFDDVIFTVDEA